MEELARHILHTVFTAPEPKAKVHHCDHTLLIHCPLLTLDKINLETI